MGQPQMSRRKFLGAVGVAAAGAALPAMSRDNGASEQAFGAAPPKYIPYKGAPKPDLPAVGSSVPAGYFHYPANPTTYSHKAPGNGGTVSMLLQQDSPPPPASSNKWWAALNKALNVHLDFQVVPFSEYSTKLSVVTAGSDIPDAAQITGIPGQLPILEKHFADLTKYLSGDAIKEYPALAAFPTASWEIGTIGGRIWGTPQPRVPTGLILTYRGDTIDKMDLSVNLRDGRDLTNLSKELSNPRQNIWAWGEQPNGFLLPIILEMMGAPNGWKVSKSGKFTSMNESPQMKEALNVLAQWWKAGYIEPDSFASPASDYAWWESGRITLLSQQIPNWNALAPVYPQLKINVIRVPKWNGGGFADKHLTVPGYTAFTAFKKGSHSRIKEMLRIADFLAAPFGTKEFLTVNWGVEGWDYNLNGSDPTPTPQHTSEALPIGYVSSSAQWTIYSPGQQQAVQDQYNYLKAVMPTAVPNPTLGLYSQTALTTGAAANNTLLNVQNDIVQGRRPVSDWDQAVTSWKQQAGQKMADEYTKSYEQLHKNTK